MVIASSLLTGVWICAGRGGFGGGGGDLHDLHRGSYHVTCRLKFYYKLYMNEKDKKMIETGMQQDK